MTEGRNAVAGPLQRPVGRLAPERASELAASIEQMERADFEKWCKEHHHGTIDDMLTPLDRSLRALMWSAWQGRAALRHRCRGVAHPGCNYLTACGSICNKCGQSV